MSAIRIMTANLWGPHVDPDGLATVLSDVDPDVLAVQELDLPAAEVIAAHFKEHTLDPIGETMGSGIAARHAADITRIPLRYRSGWSAALSTDAWPQLSAPLEVVGVHLANPVGWPWWRSVAHRRYQVDGLLAHCDAAPRRRVVVGDFNASPAWPVYRQLAERFTDGPLAANGAQRTWRFQGRTPPLLRIDHAFGEDVQFTSARPVTVPGADHMGLVVDIEA